MQDALIKCSVPNNDAHIFTEVPLTSDLRGIEPHRISRLRVYCDSLRKGLQKPTTELSVIKESSQQLLFMQTMAWDWPQV